MAVERIDYQAGNIAGKARWSGTTRSAEAAAPADHAELARRHRPRIKRAAEMAGDKYVAFVADMYGDGKTRAGPPEAPAR